MSELIQKMNDMIKNDQIPENIKNILNGISSGSSSNESNSTNATQKNEASLSSEASNNTQNSNNNFTFSNNNLNSSNNETRNHSETTTEFPNFDIGTILKMKSVMDNINQESNDPRANLLKSLKPYLRSSRKEKVDQYVQLFRMGKVFEIMNPLGGDKKNDV